MTRRSRKRWIAALALALGVGLASGSEATEQPEVAGKLDRFGSYGAAGAVHERVRAPEPSNRPLGVGSTLVVDDHGLLVAERHAGVVVRVDPRGRPVARLELSGDLGRLGAAGRRKCLFANRHMAV